MSHERLLFRMCAAISLLASLALPATAGEESTDISVTQSVHEPGYVGRPGPLWSGDIVVGDHVHFIYRVDNNGSTPADTTLRVNDSSLRVSPVGTPGAQHFWNRPMQLFGHSSYGADQCPDFGWQECDVTIGPGETFWLLLELSAKAPGHFAMSASIEPPSGDSNASNDTTQVFSATNKCSMEGTADADVLVGTSEIDSICGYGGNDTLTAVGSEDKVFGGAGDDEMAGDYAHQIFVGGEGHDTMNFEGATGSVQISLENAVAIADGQGADVVVEVESIIGTSDGDYLEGSSTANTLIGSKGPDKISGRGGHDRLRGKSGRDLFASKDRRRDDVGGGDGRDRGHLDGRDARKSLHVVETRPFEDRDPDR